MTSQITLPPANPSLVSTPRRLAALVLAAALGFATTGCRSVTMPYSASFASVQIQNRTAIQIRDATVSVFQQDGYSVAALGPKDVVFEKEGTKMDKWAYGNWVGGAPVYIKVVAVLVPLPPTRYRLQCNAFVVRNPGDPTFEDDIKLSNLHRTKYQLMLDKIADGLK